MTVEVDCPLCGESGVQVELDDGWAYDLYGIRCPWGCNLSKDDQRKCEERAQYEAHEYARRRHDY